MAKGFNRGPSMGGGGGNPMMAQLQKLQAQMALAQEHLAEETITVTAGGGAIKITMTGDQKCKAIEIDPEILNDMVHTAVNLALDKSKELQEKTMGPLSAGLPF